jgi:hypothetical protein
MTDDFAGRTMSGRVNLTEAFIAQDGRPLIPAYTVQSVRDDQANFTYWVVNLHDIVIDDGRQFNLQLFHDREEAEAFAVSRRRKSQ